MKISTPVTFLMLLSKDSHMKHNIEKINDKIFENMDLCIEDHDCELPYRCCQGIFFKYCCTENGKGFRVKRRSFPNITFPPLDIPLPLPKPFPSPIPQPVPIPIPIPLPQPTPSPYPIPSY